MAAVIVTCEELVAIIREEVSYDALACGRLQPPMVAALEALRERGLVPGVRHAQVAQALAWAVYEQEAESYGY